MSGGHTPGPWVCDLGDTGVMDNHIAYASLDDGQKELARIRLDRPNAADTANLMRAAPDLLEVARMVVEASDLSGVNGPLAEAARAALSKASPSTGGAGV